MTGPRPTHAATKTWCRAAFIVLLFAGFVAIQATTLAADHQHAGHDCALCHVGHMPVFEAPAAFSLSSPHTLEWRNWHDQAPATREQASDLRHSRAPPA